ncbi:MAG: sugar phosphate isomerase/epimerase [Acidobacteriota bacterium]|nr:sugar phosphate isomerase/epimerase [Acidobacteriota bacterium]
MKISLGSWAFSFGPWASNPIPFDAVLTRLAEAGYDGVDVSGFPPHASLDAYPTGQSRRELARTIRDRGLGISGYAADFSCVNPTAPGNESRYLDLVRRNIEMCAAIGSPALRVDSVAAPGALEPNEFEPAFHRTAGLWAEAAALAEAAGIRLVWEFEPGFEFNKPDEVVRMHQEVRHPNFSIVFDTSHAYMCAVAGARQTGRREILPGGVEAFLDKLQGRIGAIHLIDSDGTLHSDETSTHYPFGEGLIDFDRLAPKLLAVPNIEWWTIDLSFSARVRDLVEPSRKFVANLLERYEPKN